MNVTAWARQPTTLVATGLLVGAAVYWLSGSVPLAAAAAAVVPGAVNDHTTDLLTKIEALEDRFKTVERSK
jgi:hypothetical protein